MSSPIFKEVNGGNIISARTGDRVLWVDVDSMPLDEARRIIDVVLPALEAAFAKPHDR